MDCEGFREDWTAWHEGWLEADAAAAMQRHRDGCGACARFDTQMRQMLDALATLPPRGEPEQPVRRVPAHDWRRLGAVAATLVVGVLLGLLLAQPFGGERLEARAVAFDGPGMHRVTVAFESPRPLRNVDFVIELPPGAEMVGFPGERRVQWSGRLAAGKSRLDLPLRIAEGADLGPLVAHVVHGSGERTLEVPLELRGGGNGDDSI